MRLPMKYIFSISLLLLSSLLAAQKNDAIIQTAQVQEALARAIVNRPAILVADLAESSGHSKSP